MSGLNEVELAVAWEVDLWGRLRRANEAARADLLGTEEARRGVILSLVADVATAYFELLDIDQRLAMSRATVATRLAGSSSSNRSDGIVAGGR